MKILSTIIFICFSIIVKGQDITYTLTHGGGRKWIGVEKVKTLSGPSSTDLTFHANHKVDAQYHFSHKNPATEKWLLISGATTRDENITIMIGNVEYTVIFSKTSNGSDFITLTHRKNDKVVTRSYYSE